MNMDFKIKQVPEDFRVAEVPKLKPGGEGRYYYFWMKKKNLNTIRAVKIASRGLKIGMDRFGWAGNKDKNAVTSQLVSIQSPVRFREKKFEEGVELKFFGKGDERIFIGNLSGNCFEIVLRGVSRKAVPAIEENFRDLKRRGVIPNFFGEQRFGGINLLIGKALLSRDFERAAELIYRKKMPDPVPAIRKVHRSSLSLYLHSYQSLMFNEMLSAYISERCSDNTEVREGGFSFLFPRRPVENSELPIIGFGTELEDQAVLKRHGLDRRSFVIRQLPGLSLEGSSRPAFAGISGLEMSLLGEDDLNRGREKIGVKFSLPKGSYATVALKALALQPK